MNAMTATTAATDAPHPVDIHIGLQIRAARLAAKMSQDVLGMNVGVSFQQIQKYERGTNRVSASKLYEIGQALGVSIAELFAGLPVAVTAEPAAQRSAREFALSPEGIALCLAASQASARAVAAATHLLEESRA